MKTYAGPLFGIAAAFNFAIGFALLFLRPLLFAPLGFDAARGSNIVLANLVGMFVVLFGYCYLRVALDARKYRVYVSIGAIGKLLAVACAVAPWLVGAVSPRLLMFFAPDLIFALLFLDYLRRTRAGFI
ncbi:MAG TPA: hypothetical protein VII49_11240 [Rhizomicrobium sp.]